MPDQTSDAEQPPVLIHEQQLLELDDLVPVEWNPNQETDATFAALVENMREVGFVEPLLVAARPDGRYDIVSGEHRWRAARILRMEQVPCIVLPETYTEDMRKIQTVRMNMLTGRLNPWRFTKLFNELAATYGPDALRRLMAIGDDKEFARIYRDVRAQLPPEIRKRLDKTKKEIKDVDDLASVIKHIFATHGEQLQHSFVVFEYGGKTHLMVRATVRTLRNLERIADECEQAGRDLNDRLNALLEVYVAASDGDSGLRSLDVDVLGSDQTATRLVVASQPERLELRPAVPLETPEPSRDDAWKEKAASALKRHRWYQTVDFGEGCVAEGKYDPREQFDVTFPMRMDGLSYIDIGCNGGLFVLEALRRGAAKAIGVDYHKDQIAKAQETAELLGWLPAAEGRLAFAAVSIYGAEERLGPEQFDVVSCLSSLDTMKRPWEALRICRALSRQLFIGEFLIPDGSKEHKVVERMPEETEGFVYVPREAMVEMLKEVGFRDVESRGVACPGKGKEREVFWCWP